MIDRANERNDKNNEKNDKPNGRRDNLILFCFKRKQVHTEP